MMESWEKLLPEQFRGCVVMPVRFEHHRDTIANAEKIIGFDAAGERCFSCHTFLLTEEGFDADEFPVLIDIYFERVALWRMPHGMWVRSKSYCDRLDRCSRELKTLPPELAASAWGFTQPSL